MSRCWEVFIDFGGGISLYPGSECVSFHLGSIKTTLRSSTRDHRRSNCLCNPGDSVCGYACNDLLSSDMSFCFLILGLHPWNSSTPPLSLGFSSHWCPKGSDVSMFDFLAPSPGYDDRNYLWNNTKRFNRSGTLISTSEKVSKWFALAWVSPTFFVRSNNGTQAYHTHYTAC